MKQETTDSGHSTHYAPWLPGAFLLGATALALVLANSSARQVYESVLNTKLVIAYGQMGIEKPLLLWINDGLMALFFLLIGLELKREFLFGHLRDRKAVYLPLLGAIGGMAFPGLIYFFVNMGNEVALKGWAIPVATDIAFALAALGLFGSRLPGGLKVFLLSLAIFDDVGAIMIIALFYTDGLSMGMMLAGGGLLILLFLMNRIGIRSLAAYLFVGAFLWVAVLKSGVHATLAGVVLAFLSLPAPPRGVHPQPCHWKTPCTDFACLWFCHYLRWQTPDSPFAGQNIIDSILHPVPLGIALGLPLGNFIGVFVMTFIGVRLLGMRLPTGATWLQLAGVAFLCGIGFTMSLFIGSLAFAQGGPMYDFDERLGILVGSALSAIIGLAILAVSQKRLKA